MERKRTSGTALLLIDFQPEWYGESHISQIFPSLAEKTTNLLKFCRETPNIEVIHVRALYSKSTSWNKWMDRFQELHSDKQIEIDGRQKVEPFAKEKEGERVFLKPTFDAFNGTDIETYLEEKQIERILVAGLLTSVCVQATACSAFLRGYKVDLIEDCCGDRSIDRHEAAIMLYGNYMYRVLDTNSLATEFK